MQAGCRRFDPVRLHHSHRMPRLPRKGRGLDDGLVLRARHEPQWPDAVPMGWHLRDFDIVKRDPIRLRMGVGLRLRLWVWHLVLQVRDGLARSSRWFGAARHRPRSGVSAVRIECSSCLTARVRRPFGPRRAVTFLRIGLKQAGLKSPGSSSDPGMCDRCSFERVWMVKGRLDVSARDLCRELRCEAKLG